MSPIALGFLITLVAGLSTGIGSAVAFFVRRADHRILAAALGFSAGVMIYVSFGEILSRAQDMLVLTYGSRLGHWASAGGFFGGMLLVGLIDWLIPGAANPHRPRSHIEWMALRDSRLVTLSPSEYTRSGRPSPLDEPQTAPPAPGAYRSYRATPGPFRLARFGLFTFLAITLHNLPEGLATFLAVIEDPRLGVAIGLAFAIHNIPEGMSVAVPIFFATGKRKRAFWLSLFSGLSKVAGALLGWLLLAGLQENGLMGVVYAAAAGVMVYISLDELLPAVREPGQNRLALARLVAGMAVMALSLLLLR